MSSEKSAKKAKLSAFAQRNGYENLDELYLAMTRETEQALAVIKSWNGVHPTTGEQIKKPKPTPSVPVSNKT
jgi:hypothetical protein